MKRLLATLLAIIVTGTLCGCSGREPSNTDHKNQPVETTTASEQTGQIEPTEPGEDADGLMTIYVPETWMMYGQSVAEFNYDEQGRLASIEMLTGSTTQYSYDDAGNRDGIIVYVNGEEVSRAVYRYRNGYAVEQIEISADQVRYYSYERDENGLCQIEYQYDQARTLQSETVYVYDELGNCEKKTVFVDGSIIYLHEYTYDESGKLTAYKATVPIAGNQVLYDKVYEYDAEGKSSKSINQADGSFCSFVFDSNGNLVEVAQGDYAITISYIQLKVEQEVYEELSRYLQSIIETLMLSL